MRVTGGVLLNRKVVCPPGVIRPAMDRMRESLFSILISKGVINNSRFLDLFAGSGIMSIEASSRGASYTCAVEKDYKKKSVILQNLSLINETECKYDLKIADVFKIIKKSFDTPFDLIYADPPFPLKDKEEIIKSVIQNKTLLKQGSYFIIHLPEEDVKHFKENYEDLNLCDKREYGRSILLFYIKG